MKHVHLIGIGGTGLSAIARVLLESGYTVSGSDHLYSPLAESVEAAGARVYIGHHPENVNGAEIVVRSSAVPDDNIEVLRALSKGVPVLKRAEFLGRLLEGKQGVAVAGTHGKTSTTAMIAWMLIQLDQDPSFIVGGVVSGLEVNAKAGKGSTFVIEADEYDRMFLGLNPQIAVITNIEHDHPDCYPTPEDFLDAFRDFVGRLTVDGILLACGDDPGTADVVAVAEMNGNTTLTYGIESPGNYYSATGLHPDPERGGYRFHLLCGGVETASVSLLVPGLHNVKNALAALAVADLLGLPLSEAAQALSTFRGTGRRFEYIGEYQGVTVISDYAHHPTEIKATLSAARSRYPEKDLWALWQPHTYSRTKLLFDAFVESFWDAHNVLVVEVYPAREPVDMDFSAKQIVDAMEHPQAHFISGLPDAVNYLLEHLKSEDVLIVLSAGDADQICEKVLSMLKLAGRGVNE
jgi:UDP-N-acetylmuramate--alanine ligase